MTDVYEAPGLTADWLNGWLAAIGVTVLVDGVRLSWSRDAIPFARFSVPDGFDLPSGLADRLPTTQSLRHSVTARTMVGVTGEFGRNVSLEAFQERAVIERSRHGNELAATVSDLVTDLDLDSLPHGAFDPPAPRGETQWSRAVACAQWLSEKGSLRPRVTASLSGVAERAQLNGLGFDYRRLPSGLHGSGSGSKVHADPVVELLCLAALSLFPVRGNGRRKDTRQRGWQDRATVRGAFSWMAWSPFLDCWGLDAFLDCFDEPFVPDLCIARYEVVPYRPAGSADTTRAYLAARCH